LPESVVGVPGTPVAGASITLGGGEAGTTAVLSLAMIRLVTETTLSTGPSWRTPGSGSPAASVVGYFFTPPATT
jgi:hypothetical protein